MLPRLLANVVDWGEDEIMLLLGCGVASVFALWWLWRCLGAVPSLGRRPAVAAPLLAAVTLSGGLLLHVTWHWTAHEIRGGQDYTVLALVMGGAWFLIYSRLFRWLGIGLMEDACERTNPAAVRALCGAIVGGMLLYCGSICGEGPSFWNNVFTVLAAGAVWFALWLALDLAAGCSRAVAEDRNEGAGLRLGGFLLATGLVLGRAAAGNWESPGATWHDLLRDGALPGVALLVAAALVERLWRPSPRDPAASLRSPGWSIGAAYLLLALAWVAHLGWWEGLPS